MLTCGRPGALRLEQSTSTARALQSPPPTLPCDGSPSTAACVPARRILPVYATITDAVIHLHAAYNAAWVGTMCTEINTTDCEGPFGGWGGPEEGEERGREASYREWSRVSEPCRCARLLPTHCYVKMTIW